MKKVLIGISVVFGIAVVGLGAYGYNVYSNIKKTADTMHEPVERENAQEESKDIKNSDPFSVLILGVDTGDLGRTDAGRSDSMMVATVNPKQGTTKLTSIPRDTRTEIVGKGIEDKINHAHAFGGVAMSMDTVEKFLNIPINYYVKMDLKGFKDIVDAVGGIQVNNSFKFSLDNDTFEKGNIYLNGSQALSYSRMRKEDPNGDFGRQARQRQVVEAVIKKGASLSTLTNYTSILEAVGKNVKTNLTFNEMVTIQKNYTQAAKNIEEIQVVGSGTKMNGIYYQIIPPAERDRVSSELRKHLEIE